MMTATPVPTITSVRFVYEEAAARAYCTIDGTEKVLPFYPGAVSLSESDLIGRTWAEALRVARDKENDAFAREARRRMAQFHSLSQLSQAREALKGLEALGAPSHILDTARRIVALAEKRYAHLTQESK